MKNSKVTYPILKLEIQNITENTKEVVNLCKSFGIDVTGVIKGANGVKPVADAFLEGGCKNIATSRMDEIIELRKNGLKSEIMLVRIPMEAEIEDLVSNVDISLNSEVKTIKLINEEAKKQGKTHKVVLMIDMGDLREGFMGCHVEDIVKAGLEIEGLSNIRLLGIGTNLGCYGSIKPTYKNLTELIQIAIEIESAIGRELEVISGGATSSLTLLMDKEIPSRINHLRIGEGILVGRDLKDFWGYDMDFIRTDTAVMSTQVIEIKEKPTYPIGEIFIDAFGQVPEYEDRGKKTRALLAAGKKDFGDHEKLVPRNENVKIVGSSSDHLIVEIEGEGVKLGDVLEFEMYYPALLYLSMSPSVTKLY